MGRTAAQTATYKLGQILGLLVIPIVVLWSIYFNNAKSDIDAVSRELVGAEILQRMSSPQIDQVELQSLATKIGTTVRLVGTPDGQFTLESERNYLLDVYQASGLAFDGDAQNRALAETGFVLLPNLLQNIGEHLTTAEKSVADKRLSLVAVGGVVMIVAQVQQGKVQLGTDFSSEYKNGIEALFQLTTSFEKSFADTVGAENGTAQALNGIPKLKSQFTDFLARDNRKIRSEVAQKLTTVLKARRGGLWRSLLLLSLAGLVSAIAGIGLAALMIRSSLLQLDAVEVANTEAQIAKRDAEHIALRFTTINADISKLNQELASNVKHLKSAQDELIKKSQTEQLGQLTATIAHEIRNPLGAIRTSAFTLGRKLTKIGFDAGDLIERINNSVNRCDSIISQLHDFATVKEPKKSFVKLDEWLSKTVREEAKRLPSNVFIECSLGLAEQQVSFDPVQLQRAIANLLINACEALQSDFQRESAAKQNLIWVTTFSESDFAVIRVSDNGPGIAAEYLQRIREPLFTTKSFGTGLGIPAIEQIVRQHGGRLDIATEKQGGAVFSIYLPHANIGAKVA